MVGGLPDPELITLVANSGHPGCTPEYTIMAVSASHVCPRSFHSFVLVWSIYYAKFSPNGLRQSDGRSIESCTLRPVAEL